MGNADKERMRKEAKHRDRGDAWPSTPLLRIKHYQARRSFPVTSSFNLTTAIRLVSINGSARGYLECGRSVSSCATPGPRDYVGRAPAIYRCPVWK